MHFHLIALLQLLHMQITSIASDKEICIFFHVKLLLQSFAFLIANSSIKWLDGRGIAYSIIRYCTPSHSLSLSMFLSFLFNFFHTLSFYLFFWHIKWCVNNSSGISDRKMCVCTNFPQEKERKQEVKTSIVFVSLRSLSSASIVCFHSTLQINDSIYYKSFTYFCSVELLSLSLFISFPHVCVLRAHFFMNEFWLHRRDSIED